MHDEGFYWVHHPMNSPPQIAYWVDGAWWFAGSNVGVVDKEVSVASLRLEPPPLPDSASKNRQVR
jgi:hypothetical protein